MAGAPGDRPDVVRRSPQTLIPSSPSTTSSGSKAPAAGRTWCAAPRKPLFLRRRAPRLPGPRRRQRAGRGASLPANPYFFVAEHHVFRGQGAGGGPDVVRRSPQTLIPSSPSTTSSWSKAPAAGRTWCVAPRKPLLFVAEHHVFLVKGAGGGPDVVRRSPQILIPSSSILFFSKMAKIDAQRPVRAFRASIFNSCQTGINYSNSKAPVYSW